MSKKTIVFVAPLNKGGTYNYYDGIVKHLKKHNPELNIVFYSSLMGYIKAHFIKSNTIFSILPFIFKPFNTKRFVFNLHGNYRLERKGKSLGVKLLYLTELNLWFSDKIMLTSYYLADKLDFRKKYCNKIIIAPNYVHQINKKNTHIKKNDFNFLTITTFKFHKKAKGVINLGNIVKRIGEKYSDKEILFTIVGNENNKIYKDIVRDFNKISFPQNVTINWLGWLNKTQLEEQYLIHNTFLYWTELDNYPGVVIDAINHNLKVLVNDYESFRYFLDNEVICLNENVLVEKIIKPYDSKKLKINTIQDTINKIKELIN